ncbi:MAG: Type 1 glutamine amidotransferase-like domain-containing protein [Candidatus Saccharimonadales bacterium]
MKLLLTSGGLRNPSIIKAFLDLCPKQASELKVAFIPTAQNVKPGNKDWVFDQLISLKDLGMKQIDIVDISAIPKDMWLPRLEESDVIFVNGGDTAYLMDCFQKFGVTQEIPRLLKDRVYIGVSAGSYIATPDLRLASGGSAAMTALGLVDFGLQVHLDTAKHPDTKNETAIRERVKGCPYKVYALDDQMAVKVDGYVVEVVGEGRYLEFAP